ncbi:MAG: DUF3098 domain-containing protein [Mucinivorans sp.]
MSKPTTPNANIALGKKNYILILIGVAMVIGGFMLMAGGGSDDPTKFNVEMFSTRRIIVAPLVILAGLALEIVAIMKRFK